MILAGASTSGVSTVNSTAVGGALGVLPGGAAGGGLDPALLAHPGAAASDHYTHVHLQLREENSRLLAQVADVQRSLQELLRLTLKQHQLQLEAVASSVSPVDRANVSSSTEETASNPDEKLVEWLNTLSLSDLAIKKVRQLATIPK